MFSRVITTVAFFFLVAFNLVAAAPGGEPVKTVTVTAPGSTSTEPASQCSTGPIQCCNSVTSATDPSATAILGLLDIVLSDLDVLVGLTCSPISVVGVGSGSCNANAVCCENNSFGSLISIGCVPVIL